MFQQSTKLHIWLTFTRTHNIITQHTVMFLIVVQSIHFRLFAMEFWLIIEDGIVSYINKRDWWTHRVISVDWSTTVSYLVHKLSSTVSFVPSKLIIAVRIMHISAFVLSLQYSFNKSFVCWYGIVKVIYVCTAATWCVHCQQIGTITGRIMEHAHDSCSRDVV